MNILVVGPHPDDQELGMGGTICRLLSQGHRVLILDITNGEPTPLGSPEQREIEWNAALEVFRGQCKNGGTVERKLLGLPNRYVEHTIEARHAVAGVMREFQAEMVFMPFFEDAHPDHKAVTRIVEDARFDAKLSNIDLPGRSGDQGLSHAVCVARKKPPGGGVRARDERLYGQPHRCALRRAVLHQGTDGADGFWRPGLRTGGACVETMRHPRALPERASAAC